MEFKFNVNDILKEPIVEINHTLIPPGFSGDRRALWDTVGKVSEIVNAVGEASATAQGLTKPITTSERLRNSEHSLFLLVDRNANGGKGAVTGMLKTGKKGLYVFDRDGQYYQVSPPCVLDFYVHESRQRAGLGKQLYEHMLQKENVEPVKMAIDRPSDKFLGFLNKHYSLNSPVKQMNNYVVFDGFFPKESGSNGVMETDNSGTPGKKQSANGLQNFSTSPYGRYGAPRPPCSMGKIIHNETSTIQRNQEPTGVKSEPLQVQQGMYNTSTVPPTNVSQSVPNMYYAQGQYNMPNDKSYYQHGNGDYPLQESMAYPYQQVLSPNPQNNYLTQNIQSTQFHPNLAQRNSELPHHLNSNPQISSPNNITLPQPNSQYYPQHIQSAPNMQQFQSNNMIPQNVYYNPQQGTPDISNGISNLSASQNQSFIKHTPTPHQLQLSQDPLIPSKPHNQESNTSDRPVEQQLRQSQSLPTPLPTHSAPFREQVSMTYTPQNNISRESYELSQHQTLPGPNINKSPSPSQIPVNQVFSNVSPGSNQNLKTDIDTNPPTVQNIPHPAQGNNPQTQYSHSREQSLPQQQYHMNQNQMLPPQSVTAMQQQYNQLQAPQPVQQLPHWLPQTASSIQSPLTNPQSSQTQPQFLQVQAQNQALQQPLQNIQSQMLQNIPSQTPVPQQSLQNIQPQVSQNIPLSQQIPQNMQPEITQNIPSQTLMPPRTHQSLANVPSAHTATNANNYQYPAPSTAQYSTPSSTVNTNQSPLFNISPQYTQNSAQPIPSSNAVPHVNQNQPRSDENRSVVKSNMNEKSFQENPVQNVTPGWQGDMVPRDEEGVLKHGYPPQYASAIHIVEEKVSSSPKLERPRSLSIQLSEERIEEINIDDVKSEIPEDHDIEIIEKEIQKIDFSDTNTGLSIEDTTDQKSTGKRTPSHLTEQGFLDLKFYHNKLW